MYTNMKKELTRKFKSGGLHEKHVVATWKLGNRLSIPLWTQGNQEKPVSRWPVAGPSRIPVDKALHHRGFESSLTVHTVSSV